MNNPTIEKRLSGKGGALITRQALRDSRSLNPIRRIRAKRYLNGKENHR